MANLKKSFNVITIGSILIDICIIIFSIFMISNPTMGIETALLILGILLLVSGIYSIIKYIINPKSIFKFELLYGILSMIFSMFAIFKPFNVASFITILIGIWLLVTSVIKFFISMEFRKINTESWIFDFTVSILTFLLGIMLIINPFNGYMVLSTYAAIMLSIYTATDLVEQFLIRKRINHIINYITKK